MYSLNCYISRHAIPTSSRRFSRPLRRETKIDALNALGNPVVTDAQIISLIVAGLDDTDAAIRSTAIQSLMRIGKPAVQVAEPSLIRLAADRGEPAEVRDHAKRALQQLHAPE